MAIGFTNITRGGVRGLSAQPSDVRMGMTFSRDGKTAETGTMNLTNLTPENIRKDVNIAGVVGTAGVLKSGIIKEVVVEYPMIQNTILGENQMEITFLDIPKYSLGLEVLEGAQFYYLASKSNIDVYFGIANKHDLKQRIWLSHRFSYFEDGYYSGKYSIYGLNFLTNSTGQYISAKNFDKLRLYFMKGNVFPDGYKTLDISQPMTFFLKKRYDHALFQYAGNMNSYNDQKPTFKIKYYVLDI